LDYTDSMIRSIEKMLKAHNYAGNCHQITLWLAQKLTDKSYAQLLTHNDELSLGQKRQLEQWIKELVEEYKPIQYIIGSVPFCDLDILVEPPILIPRPETEEWVVELISDSKNLSPLKILDLCTGSGCIALALAKAFREARVIGSDISEQAIALAQKNKDKAQLENVTFIESNLFEKITAQKFDLIVSNPPYISEDEWRGLDPSVREWEDKCALSALDEGLFLIKKIINEVPNFLNDGGQLVLEIDRLQGEAVCTFMKSCGYTDVKIKKDFSRLDRVVTGRYVSVK